MTKIQITTSKAPAEKIIKPKISPTGVLIIPKDAPEDIKEWVKNG